jgi:CubicO group peptidase (beta-lactamase class C family)
MKHGGWWFIAVSTSLFLFARPTLASELPVDWRRAVTAYVTGAMAELGAPGAAVVIVDGDGVLFAEGFGVAASGGDPVTAQTPFHLASVSKAITAMAVMQLVETGQLDLNTQLGRSNLDLGWENLPASDVTINNLLSHTSGWTEYDGLVNRVEPDLGTDALAANAQRIAATPRSHPIGEFEYSNANYDVLGYLIERASGNGYADYMKANVFTPLAMTHSFATEAEATGAGVAEGHYPFFGVTTSQRLTFVPGSVPSAFLASSASDLGNFLLAYLNGGRFNGGSVLSPQGIATLESPIVHPSGAWDGYAMGWWVFPLWSAGQLVPGSSGGTEYEVPVALEHEGDHESFASSILLIPDHELGIAVLLNINDESVPSRYHQIHFGIASILLGVAPQPFISEDAVRRNVKVLALLVVGLFLLRAWLSTRKLRRVAASGGPYQVARHLLIPLVIDVLLIAAVWWFLSTESGAPLTLVRRSTPDIVMAAALATGIGVVWATIRSARIVRALGRSKAAPT